MMERRQQRKSAVKSREQSTRLEINTIQPIELDRRHGNARDLFTVWFGSNIMLLTVITGGLAVTVFALPFYWAAAGLALGNLVGAILMALHAAQGPTLGVPQMIQTRGQFGSYGSLLVVGLVIVMYLGFSCSNLVIGSEAIASITPRASDLVGIALVGVPSLTAVIFGYAFIHAYARVMTYLSGAVLLLTFAWIIGIHGLPADFLSRNSPTAAGLLGTISTAALWQIAYAPYVSDYSRYMPPETGVRSAFWASYWGSSLGSFFPMILGAMVGLAATKSTLVAGLALLTHGIAPLVMIVLTVGVATANAMNLYCCVLSVLTFGQTLLPNWSPGPRARTTIAVVFFVLSLAGALLAKSSFVESYTDFILLLLYVLVPWTAVNLVDYYLLRRGRYDVQSFFRRDGGIYGRINYVAVQCYVLGILVQLPFVATPLYSGPVARALGGVDLSWIVGLLVTGPSYYWLAKRALANHEAQLTKAPERLSL